MATLPVAHGRSWLGRTAEGLRQARAIVGRSEGRMALQYRSERMHSLPCAAVYCAYLARYTLLECVLVRFEGRASSGGPWLEGQTRI